MPAAKLPEIPNLPGIYDEPFADSSQIPTYLVSGLARTKVAVSLSGDAGDELFCGYDRYFDMSRRWSKVNGIPNFLRKLLSGTVRNMPRPLLNSLGEFGFKYLLSKNPYNAGDRILAQADSLVIPTLQLAYQEFNSYWKPENVLLNVNEPPYSLNDPARAITIGDWERQMQYLDMVCYLPDDILTKVDRAAMSHSLETRIPLLDHRVFEFAARIPSNVNTQHENGKWPLRQILSQYVPSELIERPKMGFAVPINEWLRGPLRDWASSLLNRSTIQSQGLFDADVVLNRWDAHMNKEQDYSFQLWGILSFQSWLESIKS